ncbi:MAG: DinB family protein, partial [Nitrospinota bacterium]
IEGLNDAQINWAPKQGYNSIGVIIKHMLGAEKFWIGEKIGGTPVHRDRDDEFRGPISLAELRQRRDEVSRMTTQALEKVGEEDFQRKIATARGEKPLEEYLLWVIGHMSQHQGQVYLMKKLVEDAGVA